MKKYTHLFFTAILAIMAIFLTAIPFMPILGVKDAIISVSAFSLLFSGISLLFGPINGSLYMSIPAENAMKLFTEKLVRVYQEDIPVHGFLRSFFKSNYSMTKFVSIAVRRGTKLKASDVKRYSDGNRNKFSKSTLKQFLPPFYHEYLDLSDHHLYDAMITAVANGDLTFFADMTKEMAKDFIELRKKIERAVEFQCSEVFDTGVLTLKSGDNIDFKRKSESILGYNAAHDFSDNNINPKDILLTGCTFLRNKGRANGAVFDLILGESALMALLANTKFQAENDLKDFDLNQVYKAEMMPQGMAMHGVMSVGSYRVRLWTYPEVYESTPGTDVNFVNANKVILLPSNPDFCLEYAAVPQLISKNGTIPQKGEYLIQEEFKEIDGIHRLHIKSAPVAVPIAIDQIWTCTVLN